MLKNIVSNQSYNHLLCISSRWDGYRMDEFFIFLVIHWYEWRWMLVGFGQYLAYYSQVCLLLPSEFFWTESQTTVHSLYIIFQKLCLEITSLYRKLKWLNVNMQKTRRVVILPVYQTCLPPKILSAFHPPLAIFLLADRNDY